MLELRCDLRHKLPFRDSATAWLSPVVAPRKRDALSLDASRAIPSHATHLTGTVLAGSVSRSHSTGHVTICSRSQMSTEYLA